jgi:hypothetical protein
MLGFLFLRTRRLQAIEQKGNPSKSGGDQQKLQPVPQRSTGKARLRELCPEDHEQDHNSEDN